MFIQGHSVITLSQNDQKQGCLFPLVLTCSIVVTFLPPISKLYIKPQLPLTKTVNCVNLYVYNFLLLSAPNAKCHKKCSPEYKWYQLLRFRLSNCFVRFRQPDFFFWRIIYDLVIIISSSCTRCSIKKNICMRTFALICPLAPVCIRWYFSGPLLSI